MSGGCMKYSKDHVWAIREGEHVRIGLSDFAQQELGELAYIELPDVGVSVTKSSVLCSLDSLKAASDVYSPVTGTVSSVNTAVLEEANLVNADPLGKGWLCEIVLENPNELDELLSEQDYFKYIAE